ncbi:FAD-dependent monooxygenase [Fodinicola feengrottensis]|uniref:FAD-dependent monooxygenase n=1 Tax=Fodinicola feengrottensis TaxID=435914 RepID=UPI0024419EA6|nr:FAD-dependent monooxygenase [Fodinicola feengrottensis]
MNVLISGASIGGPALAYWLNRYGYQVTVVERASELRPGGYKVDLRGATVEVASRMGIMADVRAHSTDMQDETFSTRTTNRWSPCPPTSSPGAPRATTRSCAATSVGSFTTAPRTTWNTCSTTRSPSSSMARTA